jgi:hypothetical protein
MGVPSQGRQANTPKLREPNVADSRLTGTTIRLGFVLNLLTFYQVGYSRTLQRSDMDENVWSTTVWLDEAEPLLTVKKFHCSSGHCLSFAGIRCEILAP